MAKVASSLGSLVMVGPVGFALAFFVVTLGFTAVWPFLPLLFLRLLPLSTFMFYPFFQNGISSIGSRSGAGNSDCWPQAGHGVRMLHGPHSRFLHAGHLSSHASHRVWRQ